MTRAKALGFRSVTVNFGMFNYDFTFIAGPAENVPHYVAWAFDDKRPLVDGPPAGYGMSYFKGKKAPIVWMPRWPKTPKEHGTLCHELGHVVTVMLDYYGQPIVHGHEEVFCHALGYAVRKVLEAAPRR